MPSSRRRYRLFLQIASAKKTTRKHHRGLWPISLWRSLWLMSLRRRLQVGRVLQTTMMMDHRQRCQKQPSDSFRHRASSKRCAKPPLLLALLPRSLMPSELVEERSSLLLRRRLFSLCLRHPILSGRQKLGATKQAGAPFRCHV